MKVEGGSTTKFIYDGAKVVLERDGDDETAGALHPRGRLALQRPAQPAARWGQLRLPARWAREREADSRQLRGRREQLQLRGLRATDRAARATSPTLISSWAAMASGGRACPSYTTHRAASSTRLPMA